MNIKFSPPDITQAEIDEVIDTLKSGWITTGPKTKKLEKNISQYCGTNKSVCLNSATAGLELILRILDIGEGDEVITSAYTYSASASVIDHVGAKIVLCDTALDSFEIDYDALPSLITPKTKAIIAVDIAGKIADYNKILDIAESKKALFKSHNKYLNELGRIAVIADAAHSFGAVRNGKLSGNIADFTSFSFHAVKNLTTAEGGAVTWKTIFNVDDEEIYHKFMLWSLHGQSKDALAKTNIGAWEYDIVFTGYKCNMTDIAASLGLVQLSRYKDILARRKEIIIQYENGLKELPVKFLKHYGNNFSSSGHLLLMRINGFDETKRNALIVKLAEKGIATNVHYKPLPLHTAYKNLGFNIDKFPNAFAMYRNEITLPLHTLLTDEEVQYVIDNVKCLIKEFV